MSSKSKFSWRVFISFGLFFSFFIIFVSGTVLFLAPAGRVSNWVNWTLLGLLKSEWQAMHTVFSYTFVILSVFHLFSINWKGFLSYIKSKTKAGINKKKELRISVVMTLLIFFGTVYSVPPFSSFMDFGEYLTESWESTESEPPVPHAERLTIDELAAQLDSISADQIKRRFEKAEINFSDSLTLGEIGELNKKSPDELYAVLLEKVNTPAGSGQGIGRLTFEEFAEKNGKNIDSIMVILEQAEIKAEPNQILKECAEDNDISPKEIYDLIK